MDVLVCRCVQEPSGLKPYSRDCHSRLSYRTDSTHLLIRNRHLASDPPQLPKDATKWSITQCYETQPLLIRLLNLDLRTSHPAMLHAQLQYSLHFLHTVCSTKPVVNTIGTVFMVDTSAERRELPVTVAALVKQITWKPLQPETKQKPYRVPFALALFSLGKFVKLMSKLPYSTISLPSIGIYSAMSLGFRLAIDVLRIKALRAAPPFRVHQLCVDTR